MTTAFSTVLSPSTGDLLSDSLFCARGYKCATLHSYLSHLIPMNNNPIFKLSQIWFALIFGLRILDGAGDSSSWHFYQMGILKFQMHKSAIKANIQNHRAGEFNMFHNSKFRSNTIGMKRFFNRFRLEQKMVKRINHQSSWCVHRVSHFSLLLNGDHTECIKGRTLPCILFFVDLHVDTVCWI